MGISMRTGAIALWELRHLFHVKTKLLHGVKLMKMGKDIVMNMGVMLQAAPINLPMCAIKKAYVQSIILCANRQLIDGFCLQYNYPRSLNSSSVLIFLKYDIENTSNKKGAVASRMNCSPSSRQLKKYKFFPASRLSAGSFFMQLAGKFRVFPQELKLQDLSANVYCYSNLYNP